VNNPGSKKTDTHQRLLYLPAAKRGRARARGQPAQPMTLQRFLKADHENLPELDCPTHPTPLRPGVEHPGHFTRSIGQTDDALPTTRPFAVAIAGETPIRSTVVGQIGWLSRECPLLCLDCARCERCQAAFSHLLTNHKWRKM